MDVLVAASGKPALPSLRDIRRALVVLGGGE